MITSGTWYDEESALEDWPDAYSIDDTGTLTVYLEVAKSQVLAYAPALTEDALIPEAYAVAQLMQARNIWNASKVSPSGDIGEGSYAVTPHPLDWMVKQLLRPRRGVPVIF